MVTARISARVDPQVDAAADSVAHWIVTEVDKRLDQKIDAAVADLVNTARIDVDKGRIDHAVEARVVDRIDQLLDDAEDRIIDLIAICIDDRINQSIMAAINDLDRTGTRIASLVEDRIASLSHPSFEDWLESRITRRVYEQIDAYIRTRNKWIDDRIRERIDDHRDPEDIQPSDVPDRRSYP